MAEQDEGLRGRRPWKAAYERDYGWLGTALAEHYAGDDAKAMALAAGVFAAYDGMSVEVFEATSAAFLGSAQHPTLDADTWTPGTSRWWSYLAANGFSNYIASGGGRDFMRPISQEIYGVPRERVIGGASTLEYVEGEHGGTVIHKATPDYLDDGNEKPVRIWSRTGRRPMLAAGNSNGDVPMLDFTQHDGRKPILRMFVLHDDAEREFEYTVGAEQALNRADKDGWTLDD